MSVTEFAAMIRRRALLIAALTIGLVAIVAAWSLTSPTVYEAKATMLVSVKSVLIGPEAPSEDAATPEAEAGEEGVGATPEPALRILQPRLINVPAESLDSYAEVVETNGEIYEDASERLDEALSPGELRQKTSVSRPPRSQLIDITARDGDPERAAEIANAVGRQASRFIEGLAELEADLGSGESLLSVNLAVPAAAPNAPASPQVTRNIIFGLLAGLGLGLAVAVLREIFDTRLREISAVRDVVDLPVLATIDFDRRLRTQPMLLQQDDLDQAEIAQERLADIWAHSRVAEEFRQLRVNLQFFNIDGRPRSIVVTSSKPGEGKTTTAGNLAITMALAGEPVVLVDCDLRNPTVHRALGVGDHPGVTDVLIGRSSLDEALISGRRLSVLTAGAIPPNPTELLGSQAMADLVDELHGRFGAVIIDTPPTLPFADPAVLAPLCGATLLVVRINHTRVAELERAAAGLIGVDARLQGTVVNMVNASRLGSKYSYYYRYGDKNGGPGGLSGDLADLVPRGHTNGHPETDVVRGRHAGREA